MQTNRETLFRNFQNTKKEAMNNPLRIFMINWRQEHLPLAEKLSRENIDIVYWAWSGENNKDWPQLQRLFPNIIIHSYDEIFRFLPAKGIDPSRFAPVGKSLLSKLAECESEVMTMMTRMDHSWSGMPIHLKKRLYYEMVKYWSGVLLALNPDCVIHSCVPHNGGSDYVLYCLCRLWQIKQFYFHFTFVGARSLIIDSREDGCIPLESDYEKNLSRNIRIEELDEDIRDEYLKHTDKNKDAIPVFMKGLIHNYVQKKEANRVNRICRFLWDGCRMVFRSVFKRPKLVAFQDMGRMELFLNKIRWKLHISNLKREYYRLIDTNLLLSQPYVYLPLQYQPEASSSPLGDVFADQLLLAKILDFCLPQGWKIYVKEHHVIQWNYDIAKTYRARPSGYYQDLAKLSNVRIVSPDIPSFDLISSSKAVATCTGTAAWEAVLRGIPALAFGYPWFMHCPGIFRVQDAEACRKALSDIQGGKVAINRQNTINYLYFLGKHALKAATDSSKLEGTGVSMEESLNFLFEGIVSRLKENRVEI